MTLIASDLAYPNEEGDGESDLRPCCWVDGCRAYVRDSTG